MEELAPFTPEEMQSLPLYAKEGLDECAKEMLLDQSSSIGTSPNKIMDAVPDTTSSQDTDEVMLVELPPLTGDELLCDSNDKDLQQPSDDTSPPTLIGNAELSNTSAASGSNVGVV